MIQQGYIITTKEGGKKAKVKTSENDIIDDVLLLYNYGECSNIDENSESSLVLLFYAMGSKTNAFAIPYNVLLQPLLESSEKAIGNFSKGNKITFKKNGDIEITTEQAIFSKDIKLSGVLKINNIQVLTSQQPAVSNPTGGSIIDAEARASLIDLINKLKTHGVIA